MALQLFTTNPLIVIIGTKLYLKWKLNQLDNLPILLIDDVWHYCNIVSVQGVPKMDPMLKYFLQHGGIFWDTL